MEQVRQLAREGGAALVVAHDPRAVTHFCDRAVFLEQGQVVVDAAPEATLAQVVAHGRPGYAPPHGEGPVLTEARVPA
jgi:ABC-type hemin transport system ATPase subunit